jgi:predicted transcriptional regulator
MDLLKSQPQPAVEPLDAETLAALDIGLAQIERGEVYTIDEVREHLKQRAETWRKTQETLQPA